MKEKDFQIIFNKSNQIVGVHELKITKGKSIPFSALQEHQEFYLNKAINGKLNIRIQDPPFNLGTSFATKRPFDAVTIEKVNAYVVILFYEPRKKKNFYYITIQAWNYLKETLNRKSITENLAIEFASYSGYIKNDNMFYT